MTAIHASAAAATGPVSSPGGKPASGRELTDDNIWIIERRREIASLHAIIERLETATSAENSVAGAGTAKRLPLLQIQTRGAHQSALDKARQPHTGPQ